jgi:hypothetical protein
MKDLKKLIRTAYLVKVERSEISNMYSLRFKI